MSYVWYYFGHWVSKLLEFDCMAWLSPAYQFFMKKSYDTQRKTGKGPWK